MLAWCGCGPGRLGGPGARRRGARSLGRSALGRGGVPGPLGGSWMLAWCGCGPGRLGGPGARRRGARSLGRSAVRMKIVVQKFGGSSLATPELREIAASRVLAVRDAGNAPVVVCSAMGRAPDPYATDTLLGLLGPALPGPNRDLLDAIEQGIIPVVAGFQGVTRSNAISTLGRGGSDLTAIALGEALKSESVEI